MTHPSITIKPATPAPSMPSPNVEAVAEQAATPSLQSILKAFERDGNGDTELLKSILKAKEKEDQRLAAEHALKVEQLKVQHTLVVSQVQLYYAQMHAQQQQYAAAMQAAAGVQSHGSKPLAQSYAPYSPTSPPAETSPYLKAAPGSHLHPCPPVSVPQHPAYGLSPRSSASPPPIGSTGDSLKRSRACSTVSANSVSSSSMSSSSAYTHQLHPIQQAQAQAAAEPATKKARRAPGKPSHEDVMAALRLKCERNQAVTGWASQQRQQVLAPPVPASAAVNTKKRPIAPRDPSVEIAAASMQPPAGRPVSRSPPLRHTALVARAAEPAKAEVAEVAPTPAPVNNSGHSSSFRMLLNASEAIAAGAA